MYAQKLSIFLLKIRCSMSRRALRRGSASSPLLLYSWLAVCRIVSHRCSHLSAQQSPFLYLRSILLFQEENCQWDLISGILWLLDTVLFFFKKKKSGCNALGREGLYTMIWMGGARLLVVAQVHSSCVFFHVRSTLTFSGKSAYQWALPNNSGLWEK